jgi:ketosteroid isomerase-like protein
MAALTTPDVAVVHAVWGLTGARDPRGPDLPRGLGQMTYMMTKHSGTWAIAVLQNTVIAVSPPAV